LFVAGDHKLGAFETVGDFTTVDDGRLFQEFLAVASPKVVVVPIMLDALDHGGVQTRKRWYFLLIRNDVLCSRGAFPEVTGDRTNARRIDSILDTVQILDLERLIDSRPFKRRYNTHADNPLFRGVTLTLSSLSTAERQAMAIFRPT
jgi:hypothetical protein